MQTLRRRTRVHVAAICLDTTSRVGSEARSRNTNMDKTIRNRDELSVAMNVTGEIAIKPITDDYIRKIAGWRERKADCARP